MYTDFCASINKPLTQVCISCVDAKKYGSSVCSSKRVLTRGVVKCTNGDFDTHTLYKL
jgi:hypothetical protein